VRRAEEGIVSAIDTPNIYEIPLVLHDEGLDAYIGRVLGLPPADAELGPWRNLVSRVEKSTTEVHIGLVGKYVNLPDAYLSVVEALKHGGFAHGAKVVIDWIASEDAEASWPRAASTTSTGSSFPAGSAFGASRARSPPSPTPGSTRCRSSGCASACQCAVIEFARNVVGLAGANSSEFDHQSPHPVIDLMDDQRRWSTRAARCGSAPTRRSCGPTRSCGRPTTPR